MGHPGQIQRANKAPLAPQEMIIFNAWQRFASARNGRVGLRTQCTRHFAVRVVRSSSRWPDHLVGRFAIGRCVDHEKLDRRIAGDGEDMHHVCRKKQVSPARISKDSSPTCAVAVPSSR